MNTQANNDQMKYTLDKSKGSQTDIVPKTTYKELQTQSRLAEIYAFLHLHNYYKTFKVVIKIPDKYKDYPLGGMGGAEIKDDYKWANHLPLPEMIGKWKPKETSQVEDNWNTYDINEDEYYYEICSVTIVKNKKYKKNEPRKMPRQRKPRPMNETPEPNPEPEKADPVPRQRKPVPKPETELRIQMEEIQGQMEYIQRQRTEIQRQMEEAETAYINAHLQYVAAEKAIEKSLRLKGKALQQEEKIRAELEKVKIEIASKTNKNGYVILAHDDCGGKEQVYRHAQKFEDALAIAKEAVKTGKGRQNKNIECKDECIVGEKVEALYTKNDKWYGATISKVNKIWRKGEQITQIDVAWDDGINAFNRDLNKTQIRKIQKYNRFDRARIVNLDTQEDVEEFGMYVSDEVFGYP